VSKSRRFYAQGALLSHDDMSAANEYLADLTAYVRSSLFNIKSLGISLEVNALKAVDVSLWLFEQLTSRLSRLQMDDSHNGPRWKSFRQAL